MLQSFSGDKDKLGRAEKFLRQLCDLKAYRLRLEAMSMKVDFQASYDSIMPNIEGLLEVCKAILESKTLKEFLKFALTTGNFINAVSSGTFEICYNVIMRTCTLK